VVNLCSCSLFLLVKCIWKGLIGNGVDMLSVAGCGEDTSVFEHGECEVFYGVVRQGVIACHREELDFV